jgi:hypothetical protein
MFIKAKNFGRVRIAGNMVEYFRQEKKRKEKKLLSRTRGTNRKKCKVIYLKSIFGNTLEDFGYYFKKKLGECFDSKLRRNLDV